jgi:hypothetical protein
MRGFVHRAASPNLLTPGEVDWNGVATAAPLLCSPRKQAPVLVRCWLTTATSRTATTIRRTALLLVGRAYSRALGHHPCLARTPGAEV